MYSVSFLHTTWRYRHPGKKSDKRKSVSWQRRSLRRPYSVLALGSGSIKLVLGANSPSFSDWTRVRRRLEALTGMSQNLQEVLDLVMYPSLTAPLSKGDEPLSSGCWTFWRRWRATKGEKKKRQQEKREKASQYVSTSPTLFCLHQFSGRVNNQSKTSVCVNKHAMQCKASFHVTGKNELAVNCQG